MLFEILGCCLALIWGSFMGAAFYRSLARLTQEERTPSLWKGRSKCTKCKHVLSPLDLIPIFSWVFMKGRCRYCDKPISLSYLWIELFTLSFFVIASFFFKNHIQALLLACLASTLLVMSLIDLKTFILPDELQILLCVLVVFWLLNGQNSEQAFVRGFWGVLFGAGLLLCVRFFYTWWRGIEGIGLGDVKLVGIAGLLTGLEGVTLVIMIGAISTLVFAIPFMLIQGKRDMRLMLPFGPGLAFGFLVTIIYQSGISFSLL